MPITSSKIKVRNKGFQIRDDQEVTLKEDVAKRNTLVTHSSLMRYLIDKYLGLPEDKKEAIAQEIAKIEKDNMV